MARKWSLFVSCIFLLLLSSCMLKKDCRTLETDMLNTLDRLSKQNETIEEMTIENTQLKKSRNQYKDKLSKMNAERSKDIVKPNPSDPLLELEKIKSQNREHKKIQKGLEKKISQLNFELKKRDSIIELQEDVIRLLDDTKKTIQTSLKDQISKKLFEIESTKDQVKMVFTDMILFNPGGLEINQKGKQLLLKIAASVKEKKGQNITVEGHTDNTPLKKNSTTNWELSANRAIAVVRFLEEVAGCEASSLAAVAYGASRPVATNDTEKGRRKNRRIELILHYPKPNE
jgi:chemotaxis protein MotB